VRKGCYRGLTHRRRRFIQAWRKAGGLLAHELADLRLLATHLAATGIAKHFRFKTFGIRGSQERLPDAQFAANFLCVSRVSALRFQDVRLAVYSRQITSSLAEICKYTDD
jgi:hypothetical protein